VTETPAEAVRRLREAAAAARKAGDLEGAIRDYRAALQLEAPPSAAELDRLGTLLHMTGARADAIECFRKARRAERRRTAPARRVVGKDSSLLLVGFAGFHGRLGVANVDFLEAAGLQQAHCLLLWDPTYRFFLGGIPPYADGFSALVEFIRRQVSEFAPKKVLVVGCSGSGFSAMLYGHALRADVVHAFSPAVSLDLSQVERFQPAAAVQYRSLMLELADSGVDRSLLHLPSILAQGNGKTRFYVHYGRRNQDDAERAHFLAQCPGVHLIEHATASHATAELLAGAGLLKAALHAKTESDVPRLP
jgi:hypothetical protein